MKAATEVVVGFDGSLGAECALDWAAHEADRRGVGLRIVTATPYFELPFGGIGAGAGPPVDNIEVAERVAGDGRLRAEKVLDASLIRSVSVRRSPAGGLVDASEDAALVVIGHPERGKVREFVTGSVAFAVTAHSRCDVAVVPRGDLSRPGPDTPVVVGVDGSRAAERAARRAAEVASECGAPMVLVRAWHVGSGEWYGPAAGVDVLLDQLTYYEGAARQPTEATAAAVRASFPDVAVHTSVVQAQPVTALLDAAKDAGLLVVGTRGHGGFKRLLLGSVSRALVHYAETPVLVVRP